MEKSITLLLISVLGLNLMAQKDPKSQKEQQRFEKVYFKNFNVETDEYTAEISNVVSVDAEAKFKLVIKNKTADYLVFDAAKCFANIGGAILVPKDKFITIEPFESKSRTISLIGKGLNSFFQYDFTLSGIQRVIPITQEISAPQFKLPVSVNDFEAGKFQAQLKNHEKKTDASFVKFDVQYRGDKIGFIIPSKINVLMPDGNTYANTDSKGKTFILFPGDSEKFYASWNRMPGGRLNDMQLVEMLIQFNGVFSEGEAKNLEAKQVSLIWDEALTIARK